MRCCDACFFACYDTILRGHPFMTSIIDGGGGSAKSGQGRGSKHYDVHGKKYFSGTVFCKVVD